MIGGTSVAVRPAMRFIPTKVHGVLDYLGGLLLIAFPFVLGFDSAAATWIMVGLGAGVLAYSMLTDFELGVVRTIPMPAHLLFDGLGGLFLLVSPWLFGFADVDPWWPFVLMGIVEVTAALTTHLHPDDRVRGPEHGGEARVNTVTHG